MNAFRYLVFLCVTDLIAAPVLSSSITTGLLTAPMSPSNITTANLTQADLLQGAVFGNATKGPDNNGENEEGMSAANDNSQKLFKTIESHVNRIYTPAVTLMNAFSCTTTILMLWKNNMKSSAEVYIMGIAFANLISVINYILWNFSQFEVFATNRHWQIFYSYYLAFLLPFSFIALIANTWIVMAFAVERLLAIRYPFKARVICSRSRAVKVVICIFFLALLTNGTRFFSKRVQVEIDPLTNETIHRRVFTEFGRNWLVIRIHYCFYAIAGVILPVLLLGFFNIAILVNLRIVRRKQLSLKEGITDSDPSNNVQIQRVLIAYMSAFFVCNIMSATTVGTVAIHGFAVFSKFNLEFQIRMLISTILYILNPSVNFIAYVCCNNIYRTTVKRCLFGLICCGRKRPFESSKGPAVSDRINTITTPMQNSQE